MDAIDEKLKMAQIKHGFISVGATTFPKKRLGKYCPEKDPLKVYEWFVKASNVWHLRVSDIGIVKTFEQILNELKDTEIKQ